MIDDLRSRSARWIDLEKSLWITSKGLMKTNSTSNPFQKLSKVLTFDRADSANEHIKIDALQAILVMAKSFC